jgi:hypothetical protein
MSPNCHTTAVLHPAAVATARGIGADRASAAQEQVALLPEPLLEGSVFGCETARVSAMQVRVMHRGGVPGTAFAWT